MRRVADYIAAAVQQLQAAGVESARLDVLILLEDALGKDRTQLLAHPEWEVPTVALDVLNTQVARRANHEPLAYLRGKTEFYGREFVVSPAVLVPRPESETMIELLLTTLYELAKDANQGHGLRITDVGTGSGALGITAALELPQASVELLEIDADALAVANKNVMNHTTHVSVRQSDLLPPDAAYDVILANLPYVPDDFPVNQAATYEPALALFAGQDGLDLYRRLFDQLRILRTKPLLLLLESFPYQHDALLQLALDSGYRLQAEQSFIQAFVVGTSSLAVPRA